MGRRRKKDLADKKKKRACAHCGQPITFPIGEFEPLCDKCEDETRQPESHHDVQRQWRRIS